MPSASTQLRFRPLAFLTPCNLPNVMTEINDYGKEKTHTLAQHYGRSYTDIFQGNTTVAPACVDISVEQELLEFRTHLFLMKFERVCMGKVHRRVGTTKGLKAFDVNTKLSTAAEHIGIGPTQVNNFLTTMNLPFVSKTLLQRGFEETGPAIKKVAEESCDRALQEEAILTFGELTLQEYVSSLDDPKESTNECDEDPIPGETINDNNKDNQVLPSHSQSIDFNSQSIVTNQKTVHGIVASADGAYQRRGSGKSYNSLSGTATLIGKQTGKVMAVTSRCKRCRICLAAKRKGKIPKLHDCVKNWSGSAKGMEGDMIVELLKTVKEKDVPVVTLISDDDTTGFEKARREVSKSLERVSDTNHVKKNLTNKLYNLKSKYKELSIKTITAIMKSFTYHLAQAKGNAEKVKNGMPSVVLQRFGCQDSCGEWCRLHENPKRKHKNLPWGADLQNNELKKELSQIFMSVDMNKLAKMDSTNRNESFNNTLRSKAHKDKHYGESQSLQRRLAAAACQKNEGYGYIPEVHKKLGLSPGNMTNMCTKARDADAERLKKKV